MSTASAASDCIGPQESCLPTACLDSRPQTAGAALDPIQTAQRVKRAFAPLENDLIGFSDLLMQAVYAFMTRENMMIFSPAGTAKTLFASTVFSRITGAAVFDTQMSKGTLAEELCGSLDIDEMKHGRVVHNTNHTLVDADLAFVDEFFDANDMVLRALLGIFNERVFKKGAQIEPARLHTGIAAANYVRASAVTEAVLDRFLLRAYIAPDYSPYNLLAIDQAFGRNFGCLASTEDEGRIPLADLSFLADVVRGKIVDQAIQAAPHILFMKNAVINRYRELVTENGADQERRPPYISPRTYAKSRFVLNAAALLCGRMEVSVEDLSQLRFVVTTVGGPPEEAQCFESALNGTLMRIRQEERKQIDSLAAAAELADQVMNNVRNGTEIPHSSFLQKVMRFFGLVSEGQITFDHVRRFAEDVDPTDTLVRDLKLGVIRRVQDLTRRVDGRDALRLYGG